MNFKELLQKYKNGDLTEEKEIYVSNEIEKNEAINEYLADEINLDLNINNPDLTDSEIDNNKIKEAVNKKLRKVISFSVISVFIIMFIAKYVISPIVDSFYYNPTKISTGEFHNDVFFDMRSYVELYLPGFTLYGAYSKPSGFGKYDISIKQNNLFTNDTEYTNISLIRNKKLGYFENLLIKDFFFTPYDKEKDTVRSLSKKDLDDLKELPSTSYVAAYVDFNKDLSMEELLLLESKFKNPTNSNKRLDFKWVTVRVAPKEQIILDQVGFNPNPTDGLVSGDIADTEKYPYLSLVNYYSSLKSSSQPWEKIMATGYESHFKSLLQYLYDRKDFTISLDKSKTQGDFYKSSLDYIEENGIKTYGVLVYGEADDIISLMEEDVTDCIFISDIKVSKFSK